MLGEDLEDGFGDFSPQDAINTKVTLLRKGQSIASGLGVTLYVGPTENIHTTQKNAAERLGVNEVYKILNLDGDVIEDAVFINPNDVLYVITSDDAQDGLEGTPDVEGGGAACVADEVGASPRSAQAGAMSLGGVVSGDDTARRGTGVSARGEKVGSYALGKFLGSGSFGKVHVGTHVLTGEQVALKFMSKAQMGSFQDAERVFTEIQCLNSLDHPNVIKLLQVINSPDDMVLALEYASGGDLKELVQERGALSEDTASRLFVQVLEGVTYCHRHHIVHYDLKLENILLIDGGTAAADEAAQAASAEASAQERVLGGGTVQQPQSQPRSLDQPPQEQQPGEMHDEEADLAHLRVKIADFGLSQLCNPGQTSEYAAGSLAYIAPEVFEGGETAGPPRDVWAMGVILFTMVCGRLPFGGTTYQEITANIRNVKYEIKPDDQVSESCRQLIAGMLRPDPVSRMTVLLQTRRPPAPPRPAQTQQLLFDMRIDALTNHLQRWQRQAGRRDRATRLIVLVLVLR
ncbi:Serine/threonine-protein kinase SIK1 (Protein kinase KID2) (Salt-inducible kinase 1) (SIK-1) (Serine/threonine-protein kinase SNF1-like kinase 1) (Serine/threonine-protein kinase SNF1LK) [Durusdinium trenchii]|uniref:Serine/threonine-protein kinase SIK1 (Protein kinase KID2) (Salt-inducible kinase 1) (SIK-1) (Serine/threonine-protein kinase SNF1-like kinase 1) (Serine/threonine-protein kinase SNF1LK) n=1 Tax=Durusdinium trenchii TaxID=1381693 RepID=A0ABP0K0H0_9DINO